MSYVTANDGTQIFYKQTGPMDGEPIVFSHGWPLSADAWDLQMFQLGEAGYRCIAHDRRGHGRSGSSWRKNDLDTYADDLSALLESLDVNNACLIGHSTGGGEVARYIGHHGTKRVSKAVLIAAVTPIMVKTANNPNGVPIEVFDDFRKNYIKDRAQFFLDVASGPFYNFDQTNDEVSKGLIHAWFNQGMRSDFKGAYDCIKAFSETDLTEDLRKFDVPTLIIHGDSDQVVPIETTSMMAAKIISNAQLKVYKGASHGLTHIDHERLAADLLDFLNA